MVNTRIEKPLLDTEMTVVRNEFEMGENSPDNVLIAARPRDGIPVAQLWPPPHRQPLDIERVPIDRLAAFYQKFYQPGQCHSLVVAGKFDEAKTPDPGSPTLSVRYRSPSANWNRPTPRSPPRMATAPSPCGASAIRNPSWPSTTFRRHRTPMPWPLRFCPACLAIPLPAVSTKRWSTTRRRFPQA